MSCAPCKMSFNNSEEYVTHVKMCTKARVLLQLEKKEDQDQGIEEISQEETKEIEDVKKDVTNNSEVSQEIKEVVREPNEELVDSDLSLIMKATSWTEAQAPKTNTKDLENKSEETEKTGKTVKMNYIMNQLKNMKVAKVNAKRPMTVRRMETNDVNIQYELNSANYLALKEEIDSMGAGHTWKDNDNDTMMVIESKNTHEDKKDNNTQSTIKWKVKDEKNNFETKVTMLMYHTNQGVHIQGGRRNGQVTSCSIAADLFEIFTMIVIRDKAERIKMIKETILGMDLRRKPFQVASRLMMKSAPEAKNTFKCDLCHYKSTKLTELKRHIYILHKCKSTPDIRKITEAKKRAGSPPKTERPSKKEAEDKPSPSKTPDQQSSTNLVFPSVDCLRCDFECEEENILDDHIKEMHNGKRQELRDTIRKMCESNITEDSKNPNKTFKTTEVFNTHTLKCLQCEYECKEESSLDTHMKDKHSSISGQGMETTVKEVKTNTKEIPVNNEINNTVTLKEDEPNSIVKNITLEIVKQAINKISTEKEVEDLKQANKNLNEEVDLIKLKLASLSTDLRREREAMREVKKEKENVEENYQEAARTIAEQQKQISIREEQIKVLGDLISIDKEAQEQVTTGDSVEDGWGEVYEDVTEDGDLLPHQERSLVNLGCKKCDKTVKSEKELREHMKKHMQLQSVILKCDDCDHTTQDENNLIDHVICHHNTKYTCKTCNSAFSTKPKLLEHIVGVHGFIFENSTQPESGLKCHDCDDRFITKPDLMKHKTEKHYKTRLCPFYHGTGRGCRFPANICFNIHEESITPTDTGVIDFRKIIICRNGESCVFNQRQDCFYKHIATNVIINTSTQVPSNTTLTYAQRTAFNGNKKEKCAKCNGEFNCKDDLNHHMRTSHRVAEDETMAAIIKIGQQMEHVSQRLQFLELKSMTDFPSLGKGPQRI